MKIKVITGFALGAAALTTVAVKLKNTIENGSDFTRKYIDKVEECPPYVSMQKDEDGYYSLIKRDDKPFKILQLTDLHIGGGYASRHEDTQALGIAYKVIRSTCPDMIVITGDSVCPRAHITLTRNNLHAFELITDMLEKIGVPYAFTFGNHDTDGKAYYGRRDLSEYLSSRDKCLFVQTEETEKITGFSNYYVKLKDKNGKLNSVIFMIDSNEYIKNNINYANKKHKRKYDYIHDDQVKWYEKVTRRINAAEGRKVTSFVYFHIPLQEYDEAWEKSVNADKETKYFYGSKNEAVSTSVYKSRIFDKMLELKSTKGVFCGHDHLNDFSIEYKGIRLTYGQSIDCLLYSKNLSEHKGATILKINPDGTFDIKGKKHR